MNIESKNAIHQMLDSYYSNTIRTYGACAQGVDWNGAESQWLRFHQFLPLFAKDTSFSLNDYGCGYGAFYKHLYEHKYDVHYHGFDLCSLMVEAAKNYLPYSPDYTVFVASEPEYPADYSVASGIFNVRNHVSDEDWLTHIKTVLDSMNRFSTKAFAFNALSSSSDPERKVDYLYYANPYELLNYCKCHLSNDVVLLHDYGLYEFTIIVRTSHI